jgi:alkylhydroperoxidase/carboxymuconolactone decarboxylase family protein YurZ
MTRPRLDETSRTLVTLAAQIAEGDPEEIRKGVAEAIAVGVLPLAVDELVLQSVLTVGWPRALVAAGIWRAAAGAPSPLGEDGLDYARHEEWTRRGELTCRTIYGDHYTRLRANVQALHPALEAWMVTEGYGRTLARPGLALKLRELCTVAQTAVLRTPRQLHSHLLGALRSGASIDEVDATLRVVHPLLPRAAWREARTLWQRIRDAWAATP